MKNRWNFIFSILLHCLCLHASAAVEKPPAFHLTSILENKNLIGLDFESPALRPLAETEVKEYLSYRDRKITRLQAREIESQCKTQGVVRSPFCLLILNPKLTHFNEIDPQIRREKKAKAKAVLKSLGRTDLSNLFQLVQFTSESELTQVFRQVSSAGKIKAIAERVLKQDSCQSNPLLVALGLRLENEFPSAQYKILVETLYRKAFDCGKDQSAVAAGYRLGLFQIASGKFEQAERILSQIPEPPLASLHPYPWIDYQMRINYWRAICAREMKNSVLFQGLKTKLLLNYPLSLHALILGSHFKWTQPLDPEVSLRTERGPSATRDQLIRMTRDAEVLLSKGEKATAAVLLKSEIPTVAQAEISFQFYWSVLLQRAGDLASSFQLLGGIFRQDPGLISQTTLRLMYPMEQFDKIKKSDPLGDPFLILSLVRQESAFNIGAKSSAGAQGLMQLEWSTARLFERVSKKSLWDPQTNLRVGVKYLKKLEKRFNGRIDYALAAYNAGPERIRVWAKHYPTQDPLLFLDLLPLQETRDYVSAIARNYYLYSGLYSQPNSGFEGQRLLALFGIKAPAAF